MQTDPMEEWRRLTTLYGEMGDVEIRELADQINDLTPNAQQILRDEVKKRGIVKLLESSYDPNAGDVSVEGDQEEKFDPSIRASSGDGPVDYSWKMPLCACESYDEARQRSEMLRRAKIDCWIDRSGTMAQISWGDLGPGELQILVAADQLQQAQAVIAKPVPQDIVDEIRQMDMARVDYRNPVCPRCKSEDPTLESVEPSNNWLCESCGHTWSDPMVDDTKGAETSA